MYPFLSLAQYESEQVLASLIIHVLTSYDGKYDCLGPGIRATFPNFLEPLIRHTSLQPLSSQKDVPSTAQFFFESFLPKSSHLFL